VWRDGGCGITVKGNNGGGWSSNGVVFWLGRRQNRDMIEWWWEWPRLRRSFHSSGGWELGGPGRVICCGGADSMLRFRLERGGDGMKHCLKMKQRQWAHLGSMGRKHDTVQKWRRRPEERRHRAEEREETTPVVLTWILLGQKMKKNHVVNSTASNGRWRFKATMS
jgi:hypothetical protein